MSKKFLTSKEVFVVKGYLSSNKDGVQPIGNAKFINAQAHAEYVIEFAKAAKDKDFEGKAPVSIQSIKDEVLKTLSKKDVEYVKVGTAPKNTTHKKLVDEALAWIDFDKKSSKTEKVNKFLQQFNVINEFEEIGLFFEDEIVKIDKIYTMKEIIEAVEATVDLL